MSAPWRHRGRSSTRLTGDPCPLLPPMCHDLEWRCRLVRQTWRSPMSVRLHQFKSHTIATERGLCYRKIVVYPILQVSIKALEDSFWEFNAAKNPDVSGTTEFDTHRVGFYDAQRP